MNEVDVLNILKESTPKILIDWPASYADITYKCDRMECDLKRLLYIKEFREKEKRENLKRRRGEKIIKTSNEMLRITNFPLMSEITDDEELDILNSILHCKLVIDNLEENILFDILCTMVIKKLIRIVSSSEYFSGYPPIALIIQIDKVLMNLMVITEELKKKIYDRELEGDRNSDNASSGKHGTNFKINKIKLSDQYPKLLGMLNKFDGAQEEKTAIDKILGKILNAKNEKTLRKYRQYLLDNFDHEKQDIT